MNIWDEPYHGMDDDREAEPVWEDFDQIVHVTDKAVLYGYKDTRFWLPKAVHHIETTPKGDQPGIVIIESRASYSKFEDSLAPKTESVGAFFTRLFKEE